MPARDRGKVLGLMGTVSGLLGLPGSIIGGYLYEKNPSLLLISGSILEAMAIPIIIFFLKDPKKDEVPPPSLP